SPESGKITCSMPGWPTIRPKAFSSEVAPVFAGHSRLRPATAGSREENAPKQKIRAPALIPSKPGRL
ncbi:MAG: hypothetical protein WCG00_18265, partial [Hyphomicrobiales bacterium]